jgi:putative peptidoglycan lipid II flippase
MTATLGRRKQYSPSPLALARMGKVLLASVALGAILALASFLRPAYEPFLLRKEIALLVVVTLGGVAYVALLFGVRALTPGEVRRALRRVPRGKGAAPEVDILP